MPINASRIDAADIARAEAAKVGDIAIERGFVFDRAGNHAGPCPRCGGKDRFSISIRKGAFLCRQCHPKGGGGAISLVMFLDDVGFRDAVETLICQRHAPVRWSNKLLDLPAKGSNAYERGQHDKAAWLWSRRKPITGSIAEVYLSALAPPLSQNTRRREHAARRCARAATSLAQDVPPVLSLRPAHQPPYP